jgi:adenine-specific DNA-methyltransferase
MVNKNRSFEKSVETFKHDEAKRKNIPTAEHQSVLKQEESNPRELKYPRNTDLDPQLMWRGKDEQDWSDLVVHAPPLYIQEKVHPKVLIDDLLRETKRAKSMEPGTQIDLFADFNGIPQGVDKTEFYQHDQNWSNRMILGDSLQVMASMAEREGLRGKVQCIYLDPPYGIKFNSNFQWSTTSREMTDGKVEHITREPEQVKAFRDTWRDGIHSYLTYLRDRLTVARDLLTDSGSIFIQIGDENVHRVRDLMDEVFGSENCVSQITFRKKLMPLGAKTLESMADYIIWYCKNKETVKYRQLFVPTIPDPSARWTGLELKDKSRRMLATDERRNISLIPKGAKVFATVPQIAPSFSEKSVYPFKFRGKLYYPPRGACWVTSEGKMQMLDFASRLIVEAENPRYIMYHNDFPYTKITNPWNDTPPAQNKVYVVQTNDNVIARCLLMTTDPSDLVLDPTCGSGTTACVAEQWGRRWITIDTSRVALALARARIMGARYPFYLLADSKDGQLKEGEVTHTAPSSQPVYGNIRHGFVYERVPHITLKSIANNAEIDVIWDKWQATLEPLRESLTKALNKNWQEWQIPREAGDPWNPRDQENFYNLKAELDKGSQADMGKVKQWFQTLNYNMGRQYVISTLPNYPAEPWSEKATQIHKEWWQARIARQEEIDKSIEDKAEFEYLYDKPYEDKRKVRVAGPFTVESLSPHRVLGVDENDDLIDPQELKSGRSDFSARQTFPQMILENLKISGVQQAHKDDRITFTALTPWPGEMVCAEGHYLEGETEKRAAIFIGPEFGTVQRADLVQAAREAGDAGFDVVIACAFNYEAHASEFKNLGKIPVLKARMNADLHMAADLKNTGQGNLFVIFGEPDIDILNPDGKSLKVMVDGRETYRVPEGSKLKVKVNGVDVFDPSTGEVRSDSADGIACWFIDTDYNEESFFVRQAYFLGANDPYSALKTTLKAEINQEAWDTLHSDISRAFDKPQSGRIAVKVINHLGDEVMKVFRV